MSEEARRPRVLIVEDSRLEREMASQALGAEASVECCASAEDESASSSASMNSVCTVPPTSS